MPHPVTLSRALLLVPLLGALLLVSSVQAVAQDLFRGWGTYRFDTEAFAAPAVGVAAYGHGYAVLRTDGRVIVQGLTSLAEAPGPPPGVQYTAIAISTSSPSPWGLALQSDGQVTVWGPGGLPAPALPVGVRYVQISAGHAHSVALRSDGVAVAWGQNSYGQTTLPTVPPGVTVLQVQAGTYATLLRLSNGTIVGSGLPAYATAPQLPPGLIYRRLWGGSGHVVALRSDGVFVAWGNKASGQLLIPAPPAGTTYLQFGLGSHHSVALRSDDVLVGWGDDFHGQASPPPLPAGAVVKEITANANATWVRLASGEVLSFGARVYGMDLPALPFGERWIDHAPGYPLAGLTSSGQIQQAAAATYTVPPLLAGTTYVAVAGGPTHKVALRSDGRVLAWGSNSHGQLAIPPLPPGMTYTSVAATWARTVMLRSDGMAIECGSSGALTIPPPPFGTTYVEADGDWASTLLRCSDGSLVVLGSHGNGQQNAPQLPPGLRYVAIASLRTMAAAIRSDGELIIWGTSTPLPSLPVGVSCVEIDSEYDTLVARLSDGTAIGFTNSYLSPLAPPPALLPGESIVGVAAASNMGVARIGPTASYVTFANGCAGTNPAGRLVPRDTPRIARTLEVEVLHLPQNMAVMAFGWNAIVPISLATLGMPGCSQLVSLDASVLLSGTNGSAQVSFAVPNTMQLVGVSFANQALVLDLAANPAGLVVSDAAMAIVGQP